jgi:ABC-type transport system substrate-binding protein
MRRLLAAALTLLMTLQGAWAAAQEAGADAQAAGQDGIGVLTAIDIAKLGRPVSETPTHVTVGSPTQVSGMFFTDMWGNNTSDIDVRTLLHGYNLVAWASQVQFVTDPMVVKELKTARVRGNVVYTVTLQQGLVYSDGQTPINAKDYVFSLLLCTSAELSALGADASRYRCIAGYDAYHAGDTDVLRGVRLIDDMTFSIAISEGDASFFYDLSNLWCQPYPRSELAPGCEVVDTPKGAMLITPGSAARPITVDGLRQTLFASGTGYMSHPRLTSGPYTLTAFDEATGKVAFALNPYYAGNYVGVKPVIDTLTLLPAQAATMVEGLQSGTYDLLNKCVDLSVIQQGLALRGQGYTAANYARMGYGFCAFACEQGPQQFVRVRQAIACVVDSEAFVQEYLGGFGIAVRGYYGMGQWMTLAAMGTLRPEDVSGSDSAKWDKLNLDALDPYAPDLARAKALLIRDGWKLNEQGKAFTEGVDGVRYKKTKDGLMRLSIRFAQAEGNEGAAMVVKQLQSALPTLGAELIVEVVPFPVLLADYYRQNGERRYDMNFMATNFLSSFDPYNTFGKDQAETGMANPSGLYDKELAQLALKIHRAKPMDYLGYTRSWLAFQQRYNELLPTLPLYSNVYFDFHTDWLQNYQPSSYASWPAAILYAYWGEPMAEEPAVEPADVADFDTAEGGDEEIIID